MHYKENDMDVEDVTMAILKILTGSWFELIKLAKLLDGVVGYKWL